MKKYTEEYKVFELDGKYKRFVVETVYNKTTDEIEIWLYHKFYGVKMYVVGMYVNEFPFIDEFIDTMEDYIEYYREKYMDKEEE